MAAPSMARAKTRSASSSSGEAAPGRRLDSRYLWLAGAALLLISSTVVALTQQPRPNPLQPVRTLSADWWLHPIERNAFKRLPGIGGQLVAIHADKDGKHIWAIGAGGLIVHSADGGTTWTRQIWMRPATPAAPQPPAPYTSAPSENLRQLQSGLQSLGLYTGPVDGLLNDALSQAIVAFQRQRQIPADGLAGQRTLNELQKALIERNSPKQQAPPPKSKASTTPFGFLSLIPEAQAASPAQTSSGDAPTKLVAGTDSLFAISFSDSRNGWISGENGTILHTADGGSTWAAQTSGTGGNIRSIAFVDALTGWAVTDGGNVLHTGNGGVEWTVLIEAIAYFGDTQFIPYSITFSDPRTGWIVGTGGTILHTMDGGTSWNFQTSGTKENLHDVAFADAQTGWIVGSGGTILHTTDGGASWTPQVSGTTYTFHSITLAGARTAWVFGSGGSIRRTVDGGASWQPQTIGIYFFVGAAAFSDAKAGWFDRDGAIMHTSDGGASWSQQTTGSDHNVLQSIAFTNPSQGWLAGNRMILRTTDGGITWSPNSVPVEDSYLFSIAFKDERTGWAAAIDGTIFQTKDGGASWLRTLCRSRS